MTQEKFKQKYRVESNRLKDWNYSSGAYFVTICTKDRVNYFGDIKNGEMELSETGKIAKQYWAEIPTHFPFVKLNEYIVMPNHVHGVIIINKTTKNDNRDVETPQWGVSTPTKIGGYNQKWQPNSLGSIINQFKSICTKQIRKLHNPNFQWQPRYHDNIIRDEIALMRIREYIMNNPATWETDSENITKEKQCVL